MLLGRLVLQRRMLARKQRDQLKPKRLNPNMLRTAGPAKTNVSKKADGPTQTNKVNPNMLRKAGPAKNSVGKKADGPTQTKKIEPKYVEFYDAAAAPKKTVNASMQRIPYLVLALIIFLVRILVERMAREGFLLYLSKA
ncbi:hypothetical protein R6Q59_030560 [Mikania micrantha]